MSTQEREKMTTQQGFTFDDPDSRTRSGCVYIPDCDEAQTLEDFLGRLVRRPRRWLGLLG